MASQAPPTESVIGMPLVESIRRATDQEWDAMVDAAPTAIYFQTREWFEIWSDYAGFRIDTRLITFRSGKKVLLPLCHQEFLGGLLKIHFLTPKGMGGFVTTEELDPDEKRELFNLLKDVTPLYCAVNPYDSLTNEFDRFNTADWTQVLDLSQGFESIFARWSKGHHSGTKKGLRQGISAETATTESDWQSYFGMYEESLARWGNDATNRYGWALFASMLKKHSPKIRLWLARYEGKLVSGALCIYHNAHVAYWHAASTREFYGKLDASHVLQYFIISDACQNGYRFYDFLPSGGIEGVAHFKGGFSPETRPVRIYVSPLVRLSGSVRAALRANPAYKLLMRGTGF